MGWLDDIAALRVKTLLLLTGDPIMYVRHFGEKAAIPAGHDTDIVNYAIILITLMPPGVTHNIAGLLAKGVDII